MIRDPGGRRWRQLALVVPVWVTVGCAGAPEAEGEPRSLDDMRVAVMELVGEARCTDPGQCRAMPFGVKPCGGPWTYLIYSTEATDSSRLAEAVVEFNRQESALNASEGRASDCLFVMEPSISCIDGRCASVP